MAANFRNRISMHATNEKLHHGVKGLPFFFLWVGWGEGGWFIFQVVFGVESRQSTWALLI